VLDRFVRDHHELLVRQLFSIRQSGTVLEYVEQFSSLVDQLNAYEQIQDPLHYTMKFIDGLKPEFKSPVLMQRPSTLDIAFVLAQLQEEVAEPYKKQRHPFKHSLPLPAPPVKQTKLPAISAEDKRASDAARAQSADDRWRALRNYRRAKGLCQFCAEKWSKDHKCAETVQLHALQEMLEFLTLRMILSLRLSLLGMEMSSYSLLCQRQQFLVLRLPELCACWVLFKSSLSRY
jgi:hypothetical protein